MFYYYRVYGLTLRANRPIPGLTPAPGEIHDTEIEFAGTVPLTASPLAVAPTLIGEVETQREFTAEGWRQRFTHHSTREFTDFLIDLTARRIRITWTSAVIERDIAPVLLGGVMGVYLYTRGVMCLHASGVVIERTAALILGASGRGKSSTTASLVQRGFPLLTDDIAALDFQPGAVFVQPGYQHLRLWPDTAQALGYEPGTLPKVFLQPPPAEDKRYLDLTTQPNTFWLNPAPLGAIFFLGPRRAAESALRVQRLSPKAAVPDLMANLFIGQHTNAVMREQVFQHCATLAHSYPSYQIFPTARLADLPQLADAIANVCASAAR